MLQKYYVLSKLEVPETDKSRAAFRRAIVVMVMNDKYICIPYVSIFQYPIISLSILLVLYVALKNQLLFLNVQLKGNVDTRKSNLK